MPGALGPLRAMEATGGEPDVNDRGGTAGRLSFLRLRRRRPRAPQDARNKHEPQGSAVAVAGAMGITSG